MLTPFSRKTAQLEARLNSLVDLLKAANSGDDLLKATNSGDVSASAQRSPRIKPETLRVPTETSCPTAGDGHSPSISDDKHKLSLCGQQESSHTIPTSYNEYAPPTCPCRSPAGELPVALEPDETLLSIFVNNLMPEYPFVTLRPGITATELASDKPFLFMAIKMVASYKSLKSMRAQNYAIMKHLTEQMLMRSERSLEMLQAILLVLGYYHYHCMLHAQMNNLTALANSLAGDLGINRPPDAQERMRLLHPSPEAPRARTNDERRALCGVWYMNSW